MNTILLQAAPAPTSSQLAVPIVWIIVLLVPVIMIFTGTILGGLALRDIRLANGRLGGAMLASFAAGLLPSLFIIAGCSAALTLFMERFGPSARARSDLFMMLGAAGGIWLSFLMMRRMHRHATGWTPPPDSRATLNGTATAALVLTILGGMLIFTYISLPDHVRVLGSLTPREMVLVNLVVLTAGLICGVIARAERTGKVCAWICGALFLFLVLAHS